MIVVMMARIIVLELINSKDIGGGHDIGDGSDGDIDGSDNVGDDHGSGGTDVIDNDNLNVSYLSQKVQVNVTISDKKSKSIRLYLSKQWSSHVS